MNETTETRPPTSPALENEIEIDAPVEDVWAALTESDKLASWFPLEAKVTPGEGGEIWFSWGADFDGTAKITIWEPEKRLRTEW